ncbi:ABC transporter ATP-binding protein [Nocardioides sp. NPDC101246]|uniref:ABC transporter ATP-binding protein n=1 Tax=Nocardioides sp. NPDC101246 TaxID=3364336 RepID=UPI00381F074E
MTATLAVDGLTKTYSTGKGRPVVTAAQDIAFELGHGESLGVVGESGSGKTTVARMIVGLTTPDSGTIRVAGRERTGRVRGSRRRLERAKEVQMVFQDPYGSLDRRLTVRAALDDVLRRHRPEESRQDRTTRVSDLLDCVGLKPILADSHPHQLSGGQRQRVAIAKALAVGPSVLVLDEAVSALDVSVQAQILALLNQIRADTGVSLLFVSHDLAVVSEVTDKVLVMYRGKVVESGATQDVLRDPQHAYTEMLLSSAPGPQWRPERVAQLRAEFAGSER